MSLLVMSLALAACASAPAAREDSSGPASSPGGDDAQKVAAARAQLDEITSAWSRYTFAVGRCPQTMDDLLQPPVGEPLLATSPIDPWGNPYATMPGSEGAATQIVSAGPDGALLTDDDLHARATCSEP